VEKTLEERWHICTNPECGLVLNRDVNAAINILKLALYLIAVGRYSVTPPSV
jgi:transposase